MKIEVKIYLKPLILFYIFQLIKKCIAAFYTIMHQLCLSDTDDILR